MSPLHVRVRVSGEEYALPVDDVLEVADIGEIAAVPGATDAVLGVRNLRGHVLPVVELATVLGLPRGSGRATGPHGRDVARPGIRQGRGGRGRLALPRRALDQGQRGHGRAGRGPGHRP